jgi:uncharacterized protein YndB with AHSA1/START domain
MVAVPSSGTAIVTLPTDEQILITREFDAPKHLVYRVWTTPELVRRWWSAHRGEMTTCEIDLRVGGMWRYAMVANGGFEVAFHGEYREIVPNERIVSTEVYEGMPDPPAPTSTLLIEPSTSCFDSAPPAPIRASPSPKGAYLSVCYPVSAWRKYSRSLSRSAWRFDWWTSSSAATDTRTVVPAAGCWTAREARSL